MKALVYVGEEKLDFCEVADPIVNSKELVYVHRDQGKHAYRSHISRHYQHLLTAP